MVKAKWCDSTAENRRRVLTKKLRDGMTEVVKEVMGTYPHFLTDVYCGVEFSVETEALQQDWKFTVSMRQGQQAKPSQAYQIDRS